MTMNKKKTTVIQDWRLVKTLKLCNSFTDFFVHCFVFILEQDTTLSNRQSFLEMYTYTV